MLLENFTTPEQLLNIALFFMGTFILTWCAKIERKENAERSDRKEKWAFIDGRKDVELRKRSIRGLALTVVGGVMAFYGFISFLSAV